MRIALKVYASFFGVSVSPCCSQTLLIPIAFIILHNFLSFLLLSLDHRFDSQHFLIIACLSYFYVAFRCSTISFLHVFICYFLSVSSVNAFFVSHRCFSIIFPILNRRIVSPQYLNIACQKKNLLLFWCCTSSHFLIISIN